MIVSLLRRPFDPARAALCFTSTPISFATLVLISIPESHLVGLSISRPAEADRIFCHTMANSVSGCDLNIGLCEVGAFKQERQVAAAGESVDRAVAGVEAGAIAALAVTQESHVGCIGEHRVFGGRPLRRLARPARRVRSKNAHHPSARRVQCWFPGG